MIDILGTIYHVIDDEMTEGQSLNRCTLCVWGSEDGTLIDGICEDCGSKEYYIHGEDT